MNKAFLLALFLLLPAGSTAAQTVTGAGSTFVQPLLARWSQEYLRAQADKEFQPVAAGLDYEPVGSEAGVMRVQDRGVDFGATEQPLSPDEISRYGVAQFPIAIGGVVAAVNLEGAGSSRLLLTAEILADIYRGVIRVWDHPAIRALNPDFPLPGAAIVPVRRSDGSGTTATFTGYLSKFSPVWRVEVGEGLNVSWPVGIAAKGNEGVAETVKRTAGSLGYVDYATARRAGLPMAALRNREGRSVGPEPSAFQAAVAGADWLSVPDFGLKLVDAPGEAAYPLVATTFAVLPRSGASTAGRRAVLSFFDWSFDNGAGPAAELGYAPLPPPLVAQVRSYWVKAFPNAR